MTPGQRLDLFKAVRPALLEMTTADSYLHIVEFGSKDLMSWDQWVDETRGDDIEEWILWMLRKLDECELTGLHDYLVQGGPVVDVANLPWRDGQFRLFLSHLASEKTFLSILADRLDRLGVHGFVAHEAIDPGRDWIEVIRTGLFTCDALVAIMHPAFHDSPWTDQEVGFVMGQNKFAVAIRAGIDPYGFLGTVQGLPAPASLFAPEPEYSGAANVLARDIVQTLVSERRTAAPIRDALVNRLATSTSWNMSNEIVDFLKQSPQITKDQYRRLRVAENDNVEVGQAFNVSTLLDPLSQMYDEATTTSWMDEEPF